MKRGGSFSVLRALIGGCFFSIFRCFLDVGSMMEPDDSKKMQEVLQ